MKYLDLSLQTPEENLACDEVLLEICEQSKDEEVLRFWQSQQHFIVLGYGNKSKSEVFLEDCSKRNVPVLRRITGGGTVIQGPGCLNFSLILQVNRPADRILFNVTDTTDTEATSSEPLGIRDINCIVMNTHQQQLAQLLGDEVAIKGVSDLTFNGLKFSGNAQRRKKNCALFHGTFLLDFDLSLIETLLPLPSVQPQYRNNRSHKDFLCNIHLAESSVKQVLKSAWNAQSEFIWNFDSQVTIAVNERYSRKEWIFSR